MPVTDCMLVWAFHTAALGMNRCMARRAVQWSLLTSSGTVDKRQGGEITLLGKGLIVTAPVCRKGAFDPRLSHWSSLSLTCKHYGLLVSASEGSL